MDIRIQVERSLEENIRPFLREDGGDAKIKQICDGIVTLEMTGACAGCPSADFETKQMIESVLKATVPGVKGVDIQRAIDPELMEFVEKILRQKQAERASSHPSGA